ncbi:hypothetical protein RDWZM_005177 [Blomia tropicalis]|uniref:Cyanate lyase C-terminal domain-containing protein n=1 Tax=Blomia tropicalis TaxID=40697 RepID=A0A9Q0M8Y2_BLOTA|nr:hypothetical protein RDWZM_005177 [Blomia tropicalis]
MLKQIFKIYKPYQHFQHFGYRQVYNISNDDHFKLQKSDVTNVILSAKEKSNLTFAQLSDKLNVNKVWLVSAILGQQPIDEDVSKRLISALNIEGTEEQLNKLTKTMGQIPESRGNVNLQTKSDPFVRRLQEWLDVYGETLKTISREEAGDGIMSAIDCTIDFKKQTIKNKYGGPDETRIVITINGKFLDYKVNHEKN